MQILANTRSTVFIKIRTGEVDCYNKFFIISLYMQAFTTCCSKKADKKLFNLWLLKSKSSFLKISFVTFSNYLLNRGYILTKPHLIR